MVNDSQASLDNVAECNAQMLESCKVNHKQILNKIENTSHFNWMSTSGPVMNISDTMRVSLNDIYNLPGQQQKRESPTPLNVAVATCLNQSRVESTGLHNAGNIKNYLTVHGGSG